MNCSTNSKYTHDYVGTLYDIRSPLGISPAALRANKGAPQVGPGLRPAKEQGYSAYQSYRKTRADLLKTQNKKRLKAVAVDFRRIWWDKGMRGGSREGAGIWRPVPPQGYVSLGKHIDASNAISCIIRCVSRLLALLIGGYVMTFTDGKVTHNTLHDAVSRV